MRTSEVLNKAADEIQRRGWTHIGEQMGSDDPACVWGGDGDGPVCLEGGILAAIGHSARKPIRDALETCPAYRAVHAYLGLEWFTPVYTYNDVPGRTANEVIETLRACALIEAAKEDSNIKEEVSA